MPRKSHDAATAASREPVSRPSRGPGPGEGSSAAACLPISAIVPTRNRPECLGRLIGSLQTQRAAVAEMIVVDASDGSATEEVCRGTVEGPMAGRIVHVRADERGAAAQRNQALASAAQPFVLFVDDDVILREGCLQRLWDALERDAGLGGVSAMIENQKYHRPGRASALLFRLMHGRFEESYAGKCIGPALNLLPEDDPGLPDVVPVEWANTTCTLYRRAALPRPVFDPHFRGYSLKEDLFLSLTVARSWRLANARTARVFHDSQPGDHKSDPVELGRMSVVNSYHVMANALGRDRRVDLLKLFVAELFGTVTAFAGGAGVRSTLRRVRGQLRGATDVARARSGGR